MLGGACLNPYIEVHALILGCLEGPALTLRFLEVLDFTLRCLEGPALALKCLDVPTLTLRCLQRLALTLYNRYFVNGMSLPVNCYDLENIMEMILVAPFFLKFRLAFS